MRIKQLELNGFKSFMERTVLELPPGLTAIVGPNGCGKSNVVDAIRWVIGEQSPKHLRGDAMEDVICNGNAETGPLGMAEVSLLLARDDQDLATSSAATDDETEGVDALPPELARASEVLVTRRYFRSGESEYFINRVPCRLKDITELFLGTGVGTKAYAIIEQGRIDQIVNAKPEDLRLFIEEAAGVTRFRTRRVAAERKMTRTRDNLLRVQDVLRELERQKAMLERQARRAEEYHRVRIELRDLDLRVMGRRHAGWISETAELEREIAALSGEETQLRTEINRRLETTGAARNRRAADEDRLRAIEIALTEERGRIREADARAAALAGRYAELADRATAAERERQHLAGRLGALVAQRGELEAAAVASVTAEAECLAAQDAVSERLRALAASREPLEQELAEAQNASLAGVAEESRLRNVVEALRHQHEEIVGRRRRLEEEQHRLGERLHANGQAIAAAHASLSGLEAERSDLSSRRGDLLGSREVLTRDRLQAEGVVDDLRATLAAVRSRAQSLRELQDRYEGCTRGVTSLLTRDETGALLAGVLRVPAELERAVAAALGARLGSVVVQDEAAAVEGIRWLAATAGGSATVLPREAARRAAVIVPAGRRLLDAIDVDPPHWALAEALLGHVLLADDLDSATRIWRVAPSSVAVVTVAGEAIDALGAVSGGSEPAIEETLLARNRELRELALAIDEHERQEGAACERLSNLRAREGEVDTALQGVDERLQALRLAILGNQKDLERCEEERARLTAELEVWALEASGLAGADGETAAEIAARERELLDAGVRLAERRAEVASRQEAMSRWREAYAEVEERRTAAAVNAITATERRRAAETDVGRVCEQVADMEVRTRAAEEEVRRSQEGAGAADRERHEALAAQQRAAERAAELDAAREELRAAIATAERELVADDDVLRSAREKADCCRDRRGTAEVTLAERRMAVEHLSAQLAERYGLGPESLPVPSADEEMTAEDDDASARIDRLRVRLLQIGDVNPGAVAELEEVNGRHRFLAAQRDDLDRSLEDLRRTIAKLARTSRDRFAETFAAANDKLGEVFPKLFAGGAARLELTTAEEGGEPGVEIVVQPAGKKLQHLSLLSGGEKALTATALVLALFLIRPTPFCLLDEVDAPLDEANIGRFNHVIREMAESCQFVLITHNRRTMEAADTLYGITMEQPGVSKVVSVRLSEAA